MTVTREDFARSLVRWGPKRGPRVAIAPASGEFVLAIR
jgi:hypothetical protein